MNKVANPGQKAVSGIIWIYLAYYSGKFLVFLSTLVLARILSKDDFGVAGYALTVISFLDVAADLGIGPALIYSHNEKEKANTAFWLGLALSSIMTLFTWMIAPLAGIFFGDDRAIAVVRVLSFSFPIAALGSIHDILLRKELSFKKKFIPDFSRSIGKGIFSIVFALAGFGAWSLIIGQLSGMFIAMIVLWITFPWRPSFQFAFDKSRELIRYGISIVGVDILGVILVNSDYLLVGRYLGATALGVYTLAFRIPDLLIMQFCSIVSKVIFPLYSKLRDDPNSLQRGFLATTRYVVLVTAPLSLGIFLVSPPLIMLAFGEKWSEAIPIMRAISIYSLMLSLAYNAGDVYKAQGRPEILIRISLARAVVLIPALYWAASQVRSIQIVGWVHAGVAFIFGLITLAIASTLLNVSVNALWASMRPAVIATSVMVVCVMLVISFLNNYNFSYLSQLVIEVMVGIASYVGTIWIVERSIVNELVALVQKFLKKSTQTAQ